jgi:hypothetical protein
VRPQSDGECAAEGTGEECAAEEVAHHAAVVAATEVFVIRSQKGSCYEDSHNTKMPTDKSGDDVCSSEDILDLGLGDALGGQKAPWLLDSIFFNGISVSLIVQAELQDDEPEPEPHDGKLLHDCEQFLGWKEEDRPRDGSECAENGARIDGVEELVACEEV